MRNEISAHPCYESLPWSDSDSLGDRESCRCKVFLILALCPAERRDPPGLPKTHHNCSAALQNMVADTRGYKVCTRTHTVSLTGSKLELTNKGGSPNVTRTFEIETCYPVDS
uniref:ZP domain-containing protein n=1 Tax=Steinernema glaseri TaxID=37863 RepID=A0A1I8AJ08_9BILA